MRLLILATTKFAPTYNEKLISQINYFNSFDNMKADIFIDASLVEIEKMLSTSQYDLIYPTTVFDYRYTVIHPYYSNFKPPFPAARF